jgi:hypothetical protein
MAWLGFHNKWRLWKILKTLLGPFGVLKLKKPIRKKRHFLGKVS